MPGTPNRGCQGWFFVCAHFLSRRCIWKYLQKDCHIVEESVCWMIDAMIWPTQCILRHVSHACMEDVMYDMNKIILSHQNPYHFRVWVFLGSHVDICKVRITTNDAIPCGAESDSIYEWWGHFTKGFGYPNLGYPSYSSVINRSNVIGLPTWGM